MINAEVIPVFFVKGVAPDGTEYRLDIQFGEWLESDGQALAVLGNSELDKNQVKRLWRHAGRTDEPPKRLKIYLQENPEYGEWTSMSAVGNLANHKLNQHGLVNEQIKASLLEALRSGKIRSRGHQTREGTLIKITGIQFHSDDVIKWFKMEYEINTSRKELMSWDKDDSSFMQVLKDST
jgi:hypothetical protein